MALMDTVCVSCVRREGFRVRGCVEGGFSTEDVGGGGAYSGRERQRRVGRRGRLLKLRISMRTRVCFFFSFPPSPSLFLSPW